MWGRGVRVGGGDEGWARGGKRGAGKRGKVRRFTAYQEDIQNQQNWVKTNLIYNGLPLLYTVPKKNMNLRIETWLVTAGADATAYGFWLHTVQYSVCLWHLHLIQPCQD